MNVDWKNALSSERENKVLVNESKIIKGYNVKGKCWTLSEIAWLLQVVISKIPDCELRLGLCCYFNMFHLKNRLLWCCLLPKQKQGTFGRLRASHKPPCRCIWRQACGNKEIQLDVALETRLVFYCYHLRPLQIHSLKTHVDQNAFTCQRFICGSVNRDVKLCKCLTRRSK